MEGVSLNPFAGVDLVGPVTEFGSGLLESIQPIIVPVLTIGLSIAAIPMGIRLFKRLTNRVA